MSVLALPFLVAAAAATTGAPPAAVAVRAGSVAQVPVESVVSPAWDAAPETTLPVLPQILNGATEIGPAVTFSIPAGGATVRYRAYSTIIPLKNVIWGR